MDIINMLLHSASICIHRLLRPPVISDGSSFGHLRRWNRFIVFAVAAVSAAVTGGCFISPDFTDAPGLVIIPGPDTVLRYSPGAAAVIPATINGKGPFSCMIDCGSRGSVVSLKTAREINPWSSFAGDKGKVDIGDNIHIDEWRLGEALFGNFVAVVADPGNVDCILGANVMKTLTIEWNPALGLLAFDARPDLTNEKIAIQRVHFSGNRPFIMAEVNGKKTTAAMLAPGLPQSLIAPDFAAKFLRPVKKGKPLEAVVKVAGMTPRKVTMPVVKDSGAGLLAKEPDVTLAADVFSGVDITIDFHRRRVFLLDARSMDIPPKIIKRVDGEFGKSPLGESGARSGGAETPGEGKPRKKTEKAASAPNVDTDLTDPFFGR